MVETEFDGILSQDVSLERRLWTVQHFGMVNCKNFIWMFCQQIGERDSMRPGQSICMDFHSGVGTTVAEVTRIY